MVITQNVQMTIDEFEAFIARPENTERRFELIHGEIVEKTMPTEEHGLISARLIFLLGQFVYGSLLGRLTVEARHKQAHDQKNARIPDISFTRRERLLPVTTEGAVPQMPDLCIEIKSPDDTYKQMREKAAFYLSAGVALVWLVFPEKRIIETYTASEQAVYTAANEDVIGGGDVLPGFSLAVVDVFKYE